jgi:hypothetical protein
LLKHYTNNFTINLFRVDWDCVCQNPNCVELIECYTKEFTTNLDNINWFEFCSLPNAIPIIQKYRKRIENEINWSGIAKNPNGLEMLEEFLLAKRCNKEEVCSTGWDYLSSSEHTLPLLERLVKKSKTFIQKIQFHKLCDNPHGMNLLQLITENFTKYLQKIHWLKLLSNPNAFPMLYEYVDKFMDKINAHINSDTWSHIYLQELSTNPNAIRFLEQHQNRIDWNCLSQNPNAIHLIEQRLKMMQTTDRTYHSSKNKISWLRLSYNPNPNIIPLLEQYKDKFDDNDNVWGHISHNQNLISLIEQNQDKINWKDLSYNRNACHLLQKKIETLIQNNNISEELCWNPFSSDSTKIMYFYSFSPTCSYNGCYSPNNKIDILGLLIKHPSLIFETDTKMYNQWKRQTQKIISEL